MARRTVRSRGGQLRLSLGSVHVTAPKGAIRKGKTLTIQTAPPGGPRGFASTGATSLVGGPYILSTSQGEPSRPVSVRIAYDAGLLSQVSRPLVLHAWPKIHAWLPEATHDSSAGHFATVRLTSFSPLDVVDYTTWLAGTIPGNRTDLPGNCGEIPDWINGAWFPKDRNDALPSCISNRTDAGALRVNVVNNRGYAQLVRIEGATLDVNRSGSWSDAVDGIIAKGFARLSPSNGPGSLVLAPKASATIALDRPSGLLGEQAVTIKAAPRGGSAAAQLGWAVLSDLDRVKEEIGNVRDVTNCVVGAIHFETAREVEGPTTIHALHSCLDGAAGVKGAGKAILRKISAAIVATDVFQKVIDLTLGETFPARITFSFKGLPQTSRHIKLENLHLGTWGWEAGAAPAVVLGIGEATAISVGSNHSCAISNGEVRCWGADWDGQLGEGTETSSLTPVNVTGISTAKDIATGFVHTCALLGDGSVECWGSNGTGQLGDGGGPGSLTPVRVSGIGDAVAIASGYYHTCALRATGEIACWGNGIEGAVGNGGPDAIFPTPQTVSEIDNAVAISAGTNHTCAVLQGGAVKC